MDPNLYSQVQLHENGNIVAIFLRDGEFVVEGAGLPSAFQNLDDAEDFAVQQLYEGSHYYD